MGKKKRDCNEAAVAAVVEWLEGRLRGMCDLLEEATQDEDPKRREAAGFLLTLDIQQAAMAAVDVLKGEAHRFAWYTYDNQADPIDLARLLQIDDEGTRTEEVLRILREAAALLEKKIAAKKAA